MRGHRSRLLAAVAAVTLFPAVVATAAPAQAAVVAVPTIVQVTEAPTVGKAARFRFRAPAGETEVVSFQWQLTGGGWHEVVATAGKATATVVPDRFTNVLRVYAVGADGTLSDTTQLTFTAQYPPPTADQDLDSDGRPDLVTPSGAGGLWLAPGRGERGRVTVPAVNLATQGVHAGVQVITGKFTGGPFEDVFLYYPSGLRAGSAVVVPALGNGAELRPDLTGTNLSSGWFADWDGNNPVQLVNGYDADGANPEYQDLFGVIGSRAAGYGLSFYGTGPGIGNYGFPVATGAPTPTGGTDWENWRLASASPAGGTAIVLWNRSTGALFLWTSVTADPETGALTYRQHHLSDDWLPGADLTTIQLTDFDADGLPDLRAVTAAGTVTAYRITELPETGTATIKAGTPQPLA